MVVFTGEPTVLSLLAESALFSDDAAKPDGRQRPLGIASLEDKIVQQAVLWVLQSIYEQDFLGFSYGRKN